ncbi:MDR family MFS transporter [Streptomyces sp. H10-C2]|uniref:MDR family MFS transporter n=1 Tax=unclassified Streptomyces TaxID=2593676 RepID=UPI0024BB6B7B|nr:MULTISPECIES: MDR family MFS transporter [unclassified Streptomyces]MDJ0346936.1 MDR family MFS transporter [Streptomyces sp. PH10-H1]MDJ0370459.1 MDR family MFS transporter [Streptomyces sp. H10-C2]
MTVAATPAPRHIRVMMAGLMVTVFMGMLDGQIVATSLPKVVTDLGGLNLFAWVTTGYIIAASTTTPLSGKLGDLFGRKRVLMVSIVVFMAGSLASGLAGSMQLLIAFRVVQGLGAGGLVTGVLSIIGALFSPRERARYQSYLAMVFAVAALAGPAIGGVLTDGLGWRWVFFINLPIGVAALLVLGAWLRLPPSGRRDPVVDYPGIALLSGAIVTLILFASWGGSRYPWGSPVIVLLGTATLLLGALFTSVERRAVEPVMPPHLFRDSTFSLCVAVALIGGAVFLGSINFLALFVQGVTGASATVSGLVLLPMMFGLVVSTMVTGQVISRTGSYKWFPVASMAVGLVGAVLLSTMTAGTSRFSAALYMLLLGVASGLSQQVLMIAAQNTAPARDIGTATGTLTMARQAGSALGLSVFATIFYTRLGDRLPRYLSPELRAELGTSGAPVSPATTHGLSGPLAHALSRAYADALSPVFTATVPLLAAGLVMALFLRNVPLQKTDRSTPAAPRTEAHMAIATEPDKD